MCQLLLVNTNNVELNRVFLPTMLQIDSVGNGDGTGWHTVTGKKRFMYKSAKSAGDILDLGLDVREYVDSTHSIMAHVRSASKGMPITEENAHPFCGDRFTLAHNGRLYPKDEVVKYTTTTDTSVSSDSLVFLQSLEKAAKKSPELPFLDILNNTMANFKGKFAFMIYDGKTGEQYVIRGATADLHKIEIGSISPKDNLVTKIGYLVNTRKNSLEDAVSLSIQVAQAVTGIRLAWGPTIELEKNTVYRADGVDLVEIGKVVENPVTYVSEPTYYNGYNGYHSSRRAHGGENDNPNIQLPVWRFAQQISTFMKSHFLGIYDIDAIMDMFLGVSMADASIDDLERFVRFVIPRVSAPKKVRDRLLKALGAGGSIYPTIYTSGAIKGLEYPWMMNAGDSKIMERIYQYYEARESAKVVKI